MYIYIQERLAELVPYVVPCMGPHHSHVPTFPAFPAWVQVPLWMTLDTVHNPNYLHSLHFSAFPAWFPVWVQFPVCVPPLPCTYIHCISLHGCQFPVWFPLFTACPSNHLCVILTQPDILLLPFRQSKCIRFCAPKISL